jgi:hypothetical protein
MLRGAAVAGLFALALGGCQETASAPASSPETALAPSPPVKREGVSLAGATVAVVSLDGAPEAAGQDFRAALARQFAKRGVVAAPPDKAHYLLRAYLSASPESGGASIDYVVDVYDAGRVRQARLGDSFSVKGGGDAWSLMSADALDAVASDCADNLAAFLADTPEAKPAQAVSYAQ